MSAIKTIGTDFRDSTAVDSPPVRLSVNIVWYRWWRIIKNWLYYVEKFLLNQLMIFSLNLPVPASALGVYYMWGRYNYMDGYVKSEERRWIILITLNEYMICNESPWVVCDDVIDQFWLVGPRSPTIIHSTSLNFKHTHENLSGHSSVVPQRACKFFKNLRYNRICSERYQTANFEKKFRHFLCNICVVDGGLWCPDSVRLLIVWITNKGIVRGQFVWV